MADFLVQAKLLNGDYFFSIMINWLPKGSVNQICSASVIRFCHLILTVVSHYHDSLSIYGVLVVIDVMV